MSIAVHDCLYYYTTISLAVAELYDSLTEESIEATVRENLLGDQEYGEVRHELMQIFSRDNGQDGSWWQPGIGNQKFHDAWIGLKWIL